MGHNLDITTTVLSFFKERTINEHHRFRSWEHCYGYFHSNNSKAWAEESDEAALQLGFYLASWGMYRGSSFLLQHAYTIHRRAVACLAEERWDVLWDCEFGKSAADGELIPVVIQLRSCLGRAYEPFGKPTDTLVTKIILGTIGCVPAVDQFFVEGFKGYGQAYSRFNERFLNRVLKFALEHQRELLDAQTEIQKQVGKHYPLMKLVDMYFFQLGRRQ